jgi:PadR family transcriptional regulator, regulatory protein AphA
MSLRHAILGIVSAKPMTGYDLIKTFGNSVAYTWAAGQAQIYPELHKMERAGFLKSRTAARGAGEKRVYAITPAGTKELRRWVSEPVSYPAERDALRLKTTYMEMASPADARRFFFEHIDHYKRYLERLHVRLQVVNELSGPLLRARLAKEKPADHKAIIAWKALGVRGQIARAEAEIEWAHECLATLDQLHPVEGAAPKKRAVHKAPSKAVKRAG